MDVTLIDGVLESGFDMVLWQKNHLETCYCIEGEGTVEELDSGRVHKIKAGGDADKPGLGGRLAGTGKGLCREGPVSSPEV